LNGVQQQQWLLLIQMPHMPLACIAYVFLSSEKLVFFL